MSIKISLKLDFVEQYLKNPNVEDFIVFELFGERRRCKIIQITKIWKMFSDPIAELVLEVKEMVEKDE